MLNKLLNLKKKPNHKIHCSLFAFRLYLIHSCIMYRLCICIYDLKNIFDIFLYFRYKHNFFVNVIKFCNPLFALEYLKITYFRLSVKITFSTNFCLVYYYQRQFKFTYFWIKVLHVQVVRINSLFLVSSIVIYLFADRISPYRHSTFSTYMLV